MRHLIYTGPSGLRGTVLRLFLAVVIGVFSAFQAHAAADLTEQQGLEYIEKNAGPVIPEKNLPAIYKYLRAMTDRLAKAQGEIQAAGQRRFTSASQLYIVENHSPQAFVLPLQKKGVYGQRNLIVISTGLIQLIQACGQQVSEKTPDVRATQILSVILANILGHELAHPKIGQDFELGKNKTSQSEEILADRMGMDIARRAGYSSQGLLTGLLCLDAYTAANKESSTTMREAVRAAKSTHPLDILRATHLRAMLALRKMIEGQTSNWHAESVTPAFIRELHGILAKDKPAPKEKIKSPNAENLERLLGYFESDKFGMFDTHEGQVQDNLWLLRLHYEINRLEPSQYPTLNERVFQVLLKIQKSKMEVVDHQDVKDLSILTMFMSGQGKARTAKGMRESKFFSSGEWLARVKVEFPEFKHLNPLGHYLSPAALFKNYGSHLRDNLAGYMEMTRLMRGGSFDHALEWSHLLHVDFSKHFDADQFVYMLNVGSEVRAQISELKSQAVLPHHFDPYTFTIVVPGHLTPVQADEAALRTLNNFLRLNPRVRPKITAIAQKIWQARDRYALADLYAAEHTHFAWQIVFALIGKEKSEGFKELNEALIRGLTQRLAEGSMPARLSRSEGPRFARHGLAWIAPNTVHAIEKLSFEAADIRRRLFTASPVAFRTAFRKQLDQSFKIKKPETNQLDRELADIYEKMMGESFYEETRRSKENVLTAPIEDLLAEAIFDSNSSAEETQKLLRDRYLDGEGIRFTHSFNPLEPSAGFDGHWTTHQMLNANGRLLEVLIRAGVVHSFTDFLEKSYPAKDKIGGRHRLAPATYIGIIKAMPESVNAMIGEIAKIKSTEQKAAALIRAAYLLLNASKENSAEDRNFYGAEIFRDIRRRLIQIASETEMPLKRRIALFERVTNTGPLPQTDQYFREKIAPHLNRLDRENYTILKRMLEKSRFVSQNLTVEIVGRLTLAEAPSFRRKATDDGVLRFIEKLNGLIGFDSPGKDELIEKLSWASGIQEDHLLELLRDHKSVNWRRMNPQLVNWASFMTANLKDLSRAETLDLMNYLSDPHQRDFPVSVLRALKEAAEAEVDLLVAKLAKSKKYTPEEIQTLKNQGLTALRDKFESMAKDSSPTDRVPIFALLLHSGREPFDAEKEYPFNVIDQVLKLKRGSLEEIALRSWIETIPAADREFELTMSVAYQLSMMGSEKASVRSGFELFGVIGKKTGQAASILEVFDAAVNSELAGLKDSRRGLDKLDIKNKIRRNLGHDRFELVELLGAASIKTVALIRLENGDLRAVHMLNEGARETLSMNLERMKLFVQRLSANGVKGEIELFNAYVQALEQGLPQELDLRLETEKYRKMKEFFARLDTPGPWRFSVPEVDPAVINSSFYMTTYAPGVAFDDMPEGPAKESGGLKIFTALARGLLLKGQFEPDRHHKNIKMEQKGDGGTIHMIDPGQFEEFFTSWVPFRTDDRVLLARFLAGVSKANADVLLSALGGMRGAGSKNVDPASLKAAVEAALNARPDTQGRINELIKALPRAGFIMDARFSFTALKGLMVLVKENYVTPARAETILENAVGQILLRKADVSTIVNCSTLLGSK